MMRCWNCDKAIEGKIPFPFPFRETCPHCHAWLHACANCRYYNPKLGEGCEIVTADYVGDKKGFNRCEDFVLRDGAQVDAAETPADSQTNARQRFEDLFG